MRLSAIGLMIAAVLASAGVSAQSAKAPPGGTNISVVGLEDSLGKLQGMKTRNAAQAVLFLQLMKGVGKKGTSADGRSQYDYRIDVTDTGGVLVNGIDIAPILNAANAAK
ncbi:hypothetical protein VZ95_06655 [Elstera litoralis]|uniref:Uncharacterized protein n=1 Tax=Elstera litoralis TaxID=552518 RepID=A0A0F3ITW3_9PROT|nr:hypothetical protein [Elstera litoralis]KJV10180.1 hypothetical protein VZ95_06655 [Elstera litoralis]